MPTADTSGMPLGERPQVQVADRAAGEPAELALPARAGTGIDEPSIVRTRMGSTTAPAASLVTAPPDRGSGVFALDALNLLVPQQLQ